jgi:hypothetical protein
VADPQAARSSSMAALATSIGEYRIRAPPCSRRDDWRIR